MHPRTEDRILYVIVALLLLGAIIESRRFRAWMRSPEAIEISAQIEADIDHANAVDDLRRKLRRDSRGGSGRGEPLGRGARTAEEEALMIHPDWYGAVFALTVLGGLVAFIAIREWLRHRAWRRRSRRER